MSLAIEYTEVFSTAFQDLEAMYLKHMEFNFTARVLTTKYLNLRTTPETITRIRGNH